MRILVAVLLLLLFVTSGGRVAVSHYAFNLRLLADCSDEHSLTCVGHFDGCFHEMSVQGFCPISSWMSIFSYWLVGVPYIYWMISWFSLVQPDFLVFIFMLGISLFSGILFTMNLRLMFIKTWKSSNDTWLEEATLFQGWSPKMCICSMDLESHLEPATSQVSYSGKCRVALALCLLPYYKGCWNQWWIYRFRSEWV